MMRLAIYDRIIPNTEPKYSSYANTIAKRFENDPEMKVVGVFVDTCTGNTEIKEKKELTKLLKKCKSGDVDMVITKSLSRISRNTKDMIEILKMIKDTETVMYFEKENTTSETLLKAATETFPLLCMM